MEGVRCRGHSGGDIQWLGGYVGLKPERRECSGAHVAVAAPGHLPVTRMCRHCLLPSVPYPSGLPPARPAAHWLFNCVSLPFPGLILCLANLYVWPLHVSNPQHSPRLTSDAFFLQKASTQLQSLPFFKVTPHQAHVIYLNRLNSCNLIVPLELCLALLYFALKIFAECDEIIVREPILNSRTSFFPLRRPVVLNPLASKYLLPPATLQFPWSSWQNGIPFSQVHLSFCP